MLKRLANLIPEKREHRGNWNLVVSVYSRLSRIKKPIGQIFKKHLLGRLKPLPRRKGILFIGYVQAGLGLAESLRGMIRAAANRGLEFGIYPYRVGVESRIVGDFMPELYDHKHRYDINIIELAVDQVPMVFRSVDPRHLAGSYNILRTYWELSKAPQEWAAMLHGIDEIWAPNQFVYDAFKDIFTGPITIIPPCVIIEDADYPDRAALGMDSGRFYFLFSFDYYSSPYRKNPLGVLEAFQTAFPDPKENVGLILKSTGAETHHPEIKERIRFAAEADARIRVIDRTMERNEVLGLIRACDCYVSLHRAEGFGLGMVEAMSFGNVVIATNYSGSTDFLSEDTGYPVAYELRPIEPNEYVWAKDQFWAEPNLESAVKAFRLAFTDTCVRERKAAAGKILVGRKYGMASVGAEVEKRLNEITSIR
ncbi:glycosyltransferase [Phyllobacterium zundukense]|uniref:Glycosyl transferase family 1 domain-containing protein n=1 Tax=Phyllobacterium zundukense TaxID=1867719 RepID=A0A2N9VVD8_9HYPH|nr:glycosyltransferase [Phyllobacterium zundukense]PIO43456.1 hypothetical protein B5P45_18340 [Phyllobacterium zundukense]